MTLYIEKDGELFEIIIDLENYNLRKQMARSEVMDSIASFVEGN